MYLTNLYKRLTGGKPLSSTPLTAITASHTATTLDINTNNDINIDNADTMLKADTNHSIPLPLLSLNKVSYTLTTNDYSKINPTSQTLVSDINLSVMPNDKISIIGPNGAGKSTLVKLMLGLIMPTAGTIVRRDDLRTSYVPQKFAVPSILPLRVCDLLAQVTSADNTLLTDDQKQTLYKRLSIAPLWLRQVNHLSGGETQRVLLTRALLSKPNLLILDEPMQGLDPESESWLYQFIDDLPDFLQCAMVVVSHDLHWVMQGSRHVVCLNKHICCEGQPSELGVSEEFKRLFGHEFEQPYIHKHYECEHKVPTGI